MTPGKAGAEDRAGEAGEEAQRREVTEDEVLGHVEREQLLSDGRDRRRDGDDEEGDSERVERDPPPRYRLPATGQRPCPYRVGDCDEDDGRELQRIECPARQRGRLVHGGLYARSVGGEQTYEAAGVSIAKADAVVERLRAAVESTGATGFGGFAGIPSTATASSPRPRTRSGRKLILARQRGALRACGRSRAHHQRRLDAEPIRFSSSTPRTASTSRRSPTSWREPPGLPRGGRRARRRRRRSCRASTAREELDFAGTCVGLVERSALIDGSGVEEGDVVVGLPSASTRTVRSSVACSRTRTTPTRICLRRRVSTSTTLVAFAPRARTRARHGGGSSGISSVSCPTASVIDWSSWQRPAVFEGSPGTPRTASRVFNLGSGTSPSCRIQVTSS